MKWKRAIVSLLIAALCLTNVMQPLSVHAEEFVTFESEPPESESLESEPLESEPPESELPESELPESESQESESQESESQESESQESESQESEPQESESQESESEDGKSKHTIRFEIIGDGKIIVYRADGTDLTLDASTKDEDMTIKDLSDEKVKIKVESEHPIDEICVKSGDEEEKKEDVQENSLSYEMELDLKDYGASIEIKAVFTELDHGPVTYALADIGQNWGMYETLTGYTVISELGPNASYPYSHIIQVDLNHDYVYEDVTYTAYCIQYGTAAPTGGYLTEAALSVSQRNYIGYALAYGWRQSGTVYDANQYNTNTARTEYAVTQGIIWCCSQGIFNTASGESAMNKVINATFDSTHARNYYNSLKSTILGAEKKPSFDGQTLTLEWNSKNNRYEKTVTDANGILSYYDYSYAGINFSKSGNNLTIWTTTAYPSGVTANATRTIYGGENSVVTWDGWNYTQDMATYAAYSRGITSSVKIVTKEVNGSLKLKKVSANPEMTNGNSCYSLEGAVYGVYSDRACKKSVGTLTTTKTGESNELSLTQGTYYVKEITAPKGFYIDKTLHTVQVTGGNTTTLNVKDTPKYDPVRLGLEKYDVTTGQSIPQGNGSLSDARYEFKFYNGLWTKDVDPATLGKNAERSWIMKTDQNGDIFFRDAYKVSGDEFYLSSSINAYLPMGTLTIQEVEAPVGYHINSTVYVIQILPGENPGVSTYNIPMVPETVSKVTLYKSELGSNIKIPGTKFLHTFPDGTTETIVTDANGKVEILGLAQGTHKLQEIEVMGGYDLDRQIVEFVVDSKNNVSFKTSKPNDGSFDYSIDADKNGVITFFNKPSKFKVMVHKYNSNDQLLDGAEFSLYSDAALSNKVATEVSANGSLEFSSLELKKTYYLVETKAPKGYRLPLNADGSPIVYEIYAESSPVQGIFNFKINGVTYNGSSTDVTQDVYLSGTSADRIINLKVVNDVMVKLPETGSNMTIILIMGGCTIMLVALFGKKERQ